MHANLTNRMHFDRLGLLPTELLAALLTASPSRAGVPANLERALSDNVDWEAVLADARRHAVGALVYQRMLERGWTTWLSRSVRETCEAEARHARLQATVQRRAAVSIGAELQRASIRHAFLKGFPRRERFYQPPHVRLSGDLDLLIDRPAVETVRRIMQRSGFTQAACDLGYKRFRPATAWEIAYTEANHYEMAQFAKSYRLVNRPDWLMEERFVPREPFTYEVVGDEVKLHVVVDFHWALHFLLAAESPLDSRRILTTSDGHRIPTLSEEWSILITCFKLYFEAFDRPHYGLHYLVDLVAIMTTAGGTIDWPFIERVIRKYRLEAAGFYALSATEHLAGIPLVPRRLLHGLGHIELRREVDGRLSASESEYGDFVPHMFGWRIPSEFPVSWEELRRRSQEAPS